MSALRINMRATLHLLPYFDLDFHCAVLEQCAGAVITMLCWPPFFHCSQSGYITSSATFLLIMQPFDRRLLKSNIDIQHPRNL